MGAYCKGTSSRTYLNGVMVPRNVELSANNEAADPPPADR